MSTPISIRITDDLKPRLQALAVEERRSLNNLINILLEDALAQREAASAGKGGDDGKR